MWRTEAGERVLTEPEWAVFVYGLEQFLEATDPDQPAEPVSQDSDVAVTRATASGTVDRLTLGQRLVLLSEVAPALRDPLVPLPHTTLAHEAAIIEVLREFFDALELEVSLDSHGNTDYRRTLLAAAGAADNAEGGPEATDTDIEGWFRLFDRMLERLAWHPGIDFPDDWLTLPPEEAMERMRLAGYDGKAYYARPKEPTEQQVVMARKTLEKLVRATGDGCTHQHH
jgi:hypothetical protein